MGSEMCIRDRANYKGDGQRIEFRSRERIVDVGAEPVMVRPVPKVDPYSIPVEYVAPVSRLSLQTDGYDEALAYELSAIESDQLQEQRLRHELVYISPRHTDREILLGGNDPIWWQSDAVAR